MWFLLLLAAARTASAMQFRVSRSAAAYGTSTCTNWQESTVSAVVGRQALSLLIDTGSTALIVAATGCTTCGVAPLWNTANGGVSTSLLTGGSFGDGSNRWTGAVYLTNVSLGTGGLPPTRMRVAAVTAQQGGAPFQANARCTSGQYTYQGILGLGPPANSWVPNTDSWLAKAGIPAFAVSQCSATTGALFFSDFPSTEKYTPASETAYYSVTLNTVSTSASQPVRTSVTATLVDTGTTVNMLAGSAFGSVVRALDARNAVSPVLGASASAFLTGSFCLGSTSPLPAVVAHLNQRLPSLKLSFAGGMTLTAPAVGGWLEAYADSRGRSVVCPALVQSIISQNVLGWPFLSVFTVVFNSTSVGFGAPRGGC